MTQEVIPYEKIKILKLFRTDPETLIDIVMKTYEVKRIYEDPEKRIMLYVDECIQKAIQTSIPYCITLLQDIIRYMPEEEAKTQLEKCMKEIGKIKAEKCKSLGAIPTPKL
jgi:hypothetical protein